MFSGKTEELIRRLKRARIANLRVQIFKPAIDVRYHPEHIVSHDDNTIQSTPVDKSSDILSLLNKVDVVGIDKLILMALLMFVILALNGTRVIVAGLDMDYTGKPFGQIPSLLAIADYITKLHAICMVCGHIANYSYRKTDDQGQVMIGEKNLYEPRCRVCYQKH
jgi:thymidine kinase